MHKLNPLEKIDQTEFDCRCLKNEDSRKFTNIDKITKS